MEKITVAVKVGYVFCIVPSTMVKGIELSNTNTLVDVEGNVYPLYCGKTYPDSRKVDALIDDNNLETYNINDYIVK